MKIKTEEIIFSANILFRGIKDGIPSTEDIWEESVVLIISENEEDALKKAEEMGRGNEVSYKTMNGNMLSWKFVRVERVFEILNFQLRDGMEVFSRYMKNSEI